MGLSFSNTYEQIVALIERNDVNGLKALLNTIDLELIKEYCADPCPEDQLNRSLLHHAVWKDDSTILQVLMPYCEGISLEVYDAYGMTPLGASVSRGNYAAVKTLLEHSSQVNCDQHGGYYLLRNALYLNRPDIVDLLLQYNCLTKNPSIDEQNGSLIHVACDLGNEDIVRSLVEKARLDVNTEDKWKIKPIHVSAAKNHVNVMKYLHEKGADINCEDIFGNTPLGWAVFCKSAACESHLKGLNARYKEFVIPPPSTADVENELSQQIDENQRHFQQLEIEQSKEKKGKTSIPVRKTVSSMVAKIEGATNPTFELNEEKKAVTTV